MLLNQSLSGIKYEIITLNIYTRKFTRVSRDFSVKFSISFSYGVKKLVLLPSRLFAFFVPITFVFKYIMCLSGVHNSFTFFSFLFLVSSAQLEKDVLWFLRGGAHFRCCYINSLAVLRSNLSLVTRCASLEHWLVVF